MATDTQCPVCGGELQHTVDARLPGEELPKGREAWICTGFQSCGTFVDLGGGLERVHGVDDR
jgi:hypothetical protein